MLEKTRIIKKLSQIGYNTEFGELINLQDDLVKFILYLIEKEKSRPSDKEVGIGMILLLLLKNNFYARMGSPQHNLRYFLKLHGKNSLESRLMNCFEKKATDDHEKIINMLLHMQIFDDYNKNIYNKNYKFEEIFDFVLNIIPHPIKIISSLVEKDDPSYFKVMATSLDWLKNYLSEIAVSKLENFNKIQEMFFSAKGIVKRIVELKLKNYLSECSMESLLTFRSKAKEEVKEIIKNAIVAKFT